MTDRDGSQLQALLDQFRQDMARQNDAALFDQEAKRRIGQMIGRAALVGSEYGYPTSLGPRLTVFRVPAHR
jgi:hypothetical protein